jgi:transposase
MLQEFGLVKSSVGIDISKKSLEVLRYSEKGHHERFTTRTTPEGIDRLLHWLKTDDTVVLEAGSQTFRLAKTIKGYGVDVIVLNPGSVREIYASLRKTDKEDALKLARIVARNPREELPEVTVPTDEEEDARRLTTEQEHWSEQRTINKNRLHSLFVQAGLTEITKKQISSHKNREKSIALLPERFKKEAIRLQNALQSLDATIEEINLEIKDRLKRNADYTRIAMSMPGIGLVTTHAFFAYFGDCSRFFSGSQLSYYTGLVPRVDQSGDYEHYGHIIKRGCRSVRRVIIQCAWVLENSQYGGVLKTFYERLYPRIGKKKAIVATARKMIEIFYVMMKNGETYRGVPEEVIDEKMRHYGLIA